MLVNNVELIEEDDMVCLAARRNGGKFEPETFAFLEALKPNGLFVDVGAYTGIYGIRAAQLGWDVHFFEPNPANYERLLVNMERNNCSHLKKNQCALSDKKGHLNLNINPGVKMTSGGSLENTVKANRASVEVRVIPYSMLTYGLEDVIKIDVEHHELSVLKGMTTVLDSVKPTLIIEILDDEAEIVNYLRRFDYSLVDILDGRNAIFTAA